MGIAKTDRVVRKRDAATFRPTYMGMVCNIYSPPWGGTYATVMWGRPNGSYFQNWVNLDDLVVVTPEMEQAASLREQQAYERPAYKLRVKKVYQHIVKRGPLPEDFVWKPDDRYTLTFDTADLYTKDKATRRSAKQAFATLRKAIKYYTHTDEYKHSYGYTAYDYDLSGSDWNLPKDLLLEFAEWMQFDAPLGEILRDARVQAEKHAQEQEARDQQWYKRQEQWQKANGQSTFEWITRASEVDDALDLLQLNSRATQDDIKKRYRVLAKQHHPDTGGDEAYMKRLNRAYQVLTRSLE